MANLSDAFGNIEIKGSEKVIESILRLFELSDAWEYNTSIDLESTEKPTDDTCTVNFFGTGRWCYENNIEFFFRWVNDEITEEDRALLEDSDFEIIFDFTDYEPGCEVFYEATEALRHKKGVKLDETEYIQSEYSALDLSWGNRLDLEVENDDQLASMLDDMVGNEMMEFLEEEKSSLIKHYGHPLLKILDQLSLMLPNNRSLKEKFLKQQKLLM